jgi:NADH dehydrogenase [ubiquinone] 1 alpha subcomplex assembly factor 7
MELCNTHYYATRDPFGQKGDFTTAPEISQIFGELIGAWLAETWLRLGSPKAVLCEAGPGRGTLMKDILRATRNVPQFHASICIRMIENSPVLEALQRKTLQELHRDIEWKTSFDELPSLPLLLVANEFFDALPVHQYMGNGEERTIGLKGGELYWMQEGEATLERSPVSLAIMQRIAAHIHAHSGAALVIDYGYENERGYETSEGADTFQALRNHLYANPLQTPGEADLTAHVDFGELARTATEANTHPHLTTQGDFLRRLGAELRATALCKNTSNEQRTTILQGLERLLSPRQMGTLFKVLVVTSLLDKQAGF